MNQVNVFDFDHPVEFLRTVFEEKKKINSSYSIRALSKQLGFKSASTISAVFNGTRNFTPTLARKLSVPLKLGVDESRYLQIIASLKLENNPVHKEKLIDELRDIRPDLTYESYSMDVFNTISNWYSLAILTAANLKPFSKLESYQIAELFRKKITPAQAEAALERLERLGFLSCSKNHYFITEKKFKFGDEVPSRAITKYHEQVINLALEALEEQKMGERDFRATSFGISEEDLPKAHSIIKDCHEKLLALEKKESNSIYQFNSQLFSLSKHRDH